MPSARYRSDNLRQWLFWLFINTSLQWSTTYFAKYYRKSTAFRPLRIGLNTFLSVSTLTHRAVTAGCQGYPSICRRVAEKHPPSINNLRACLWQEMGLCCFTEDSNPVGPRSLCWLCQTFTSLSQVLLQLLQWYLRQRLHSSKKKGRGNKKINVSTVLCSGTIWQCFAQQWWAGVWLQPSLFIDYKAAHGSKSWWRNYRHQLILCVIYE